MRIKEHHSIGKPAWMVGRVCKEIARAVGEIKVTSGAVPDAGVHEARRAIKRARAGLRLVGRAKGPAEHTREVAALGEVGRMLSDTRDATVVFETAQELAPRSKTRPEKNAVKRLVELLEKSHGTKRVDAKLAARLRARLRSAQKRIEGWSVGKGDSKALQNAIEAGRDRLIKRMEEALEEGSDDALHTWRKRAQDFRFQLDMLKDVVPRSGLGILKKMHELTGVLGTDHDLAVLTVRMQGRKMPGLGAQERAVLLRMITRERKGLMAKARRLGKGF